MSISTRTGINARQTTVHMQITIASIHFDADQKLTGYIEKKTSKLGQFYDRIIDMSVFLKLENTGQVKDKIVELKLIVPGSTLIATESSKTFEAATDLAVDNMKRQLLKFKRRLQAKPTRTRL